MANLAPIGRHTIEDSSVSDLLAHWIAEQQQRGDDRTFALLFRVFWPMVRELDGLMLTGGSDLTSCLYGQPPHPQTETSDTWRDVWERYIALLSWLLCIPTLGIGRGMQLMNVALGGTLYLAVAVRVRGTLDRPYLDVVLSMHHQAVEALAPGMGMAATSPDGVIEAFEERDATRWWVGVQFHPAWMTHFSWSLGLFTALIDASRAYSAVARDEIETLLDEIQAWLRQQDQALTAAMVPSTSLAATQREMHEKRRAALTLQRHGV